jgi:hypothetical protein
MLENACIPSLELLMTRLNNILLLADTLLLPDAVIRDTPLHSLIVINQLHIICSSIIIRLMMTLQLGHGLAGAIQYALEHLGNKLVAFVRLLQRRRTMARSCVTRDCSLEISFIADRWLQSPTREW